MHAEFVALTFRLSSAYDLLANTLFRAENVINFNYFITIES